MPTGLPWPVVDARSQTLLELPAVRERLAARTAFSGGRALAEDLRPATDPHEVATLRAETEEALLLQERAVTGVAGAHDVRPEAASAARGITLDVPALDRVDATLRVALEVRAGVLGQEEVAPRLAARLEAVDPAPLRALRDRLDAALDRRGGLLDTASPELADVRRRLTAARRVSAASLRRLASRLRNHLQETFTTERSGRPVLAVKVSSRGSVPGIVHDSSATGQTIFVEPFELVEANNRLRELEGAEAAEVQRVLAALTAAVGEEAAEVAYCVEALAAHDLALARADLSHAWRGCPVEDGDEVDLVAARHPLLDPARAVPVDLRLAGVRALVVSGPNTGGKTVSLKTLGLLAMIAQCGLRVPARSARLPVFDRVLADIGDDQSIALSLSTFSAHVTRLVEILGQAGPGTLVLLDEVAGGTDPEEGGPLARAVIARLVEAGALVVATTHLSALKEWAAATQGVRNAAVGIDPETLRPLYTLAMGEPGASHALDIARDIGLPPEVIDAARAAMTPERREADDLLRAAADARAQAQLELRRAGEERMRAERAREEADARRAELEARVLRQREEVAEERERARRRAQEELAALTRELTDLRREIAAARKAEDSRRRVSARADRGGPTRLEDAARRRESERDKRLGEASRRVERAREGMSGLLGAEDRGPVAVGDVVADPDMGFRGTVVGIEGGVAEVQGERLRLKVPLARLVTDETATRAARQRAADEGARSRPAAPERRPDPVAVPAEVDVRGERAEDARAAVRAAVDAAAMVGRPRVRIIHGKGTGALRAAVREELARHPLVDVVEPAPLNEGGEGATYAVLEPEAV
jgi:DNA mismatch repair protein MutS2